MKPTSNLAALIERYFTERLMRHRNVSPNTIASYRDTFRLLFSFAQTRLHKPPSDLALNYLDAPFICAFLDDLEENRSAGVRTRNLRLTANPFLLPFRILRRAGLRGSYPACAGDTEQAPRQASDPFP
jgi:hypothetical protein